MPKPRGVGEPVIMSRGAKVGWYGEEGTSKTELVMSSRQVGHLLLLDTEGRSQYYDPKQYHGFEDLHSKNVRDALELLAYAEELHKPGQ